MGKGGERRKVGSHRGSCRIRLGWKCRADAALGRGSDLRPGHFPRVTRPEPLREPGDEITARGIQHLSRGRAAHGKQAAENPSCSQLPSGRCFLFSWLSWPAEQSHHHPRAVAGGYRSRGVRGSVSPGPDSVTKAAAVMEPASSLLAFLPLPPIVISSIGWENSHRLDEP